MPLPHVAPTIEVHDHRVVATTSWITQALGLFSYRRCVSIDGLSGTVRISTQWLWFGLTERTIPFTAIDRIIYRAQALPSFSPWRILGLGGESADSAFFFISLGLARDTAKVQGAEVHLFSTWEQQPCERTWVDDLAGIRTNPNATGDESSRAIVDVLKDFLRVPIASR